MYTRSAMPTELAHRFRQMGFSVPRVHVTATSIIKPDRGYGGIVVAEEWFVVLKAVNPVRRDNKTSALEYRCIPFLGVSALSFPEKLII